MYDREEEGNATAKKRRKNRVTTSPIRSDLLRSSFELSGSLWLIFWRVQQRMLMYDIVQYLVGNLPSSVKTVIRMSLPHDCCLFSGEHPHPRTARWLVIICPDIPPYSRILLFHGACGSLHLSHFSEGHQTQSGFRYPVGFQILGKSDQQQYLFDIVAWSSLRIRMHTSILESFFVGVVKSQTLGRSQEKSGFRASHHRN